MGLKQDIAGAEAYIAQAHRRIEKQRRLTSRSRNRHTVADARGLIELLSSLLVNVERKHGLLKKKAEDSLSGR